MEPVLKIFLDQQGKVRVEGTLEDDGINLQVLLKCAEAVGLRLAQRNQGMVLSDIRGNLSLNSPKV